MSGLGAVVTGRWTYEAAEHWGGENPWDIPVFVVTHRPEEEPEGGAFTFVSGVEEAVARAKEAAGDKHVHVMGGADVIRQALERRARRRADDHPRARRPRRRQASVRRLHDLAGARARRGAAVAVRDLHRLPGEEVAPADQVGAHVPLEPVPRLVAAEEPPRALEARPEDDRPVEHAGRTARARAAERGRGSGTVRDCRSSSRIAHAVSAALRNAIARASTTKTVAGRTARARPRRRATRSRAARTRARAPR